MHDDFLEPLEELDDDLVSALHKVLDVFTAHTQDSFDEVMTKGIWPIAKVAGLDRVCIYRIAKQQGEQGFSQVYCWSKAEGGTAAHDGPPKTLYTHPVMEKWLKVVEKDACINVTISDETGDVLDFLKSLGVKSLLLVPVFTHGVIWGIVCFQDFTNARHFDMNTVTFLRSAARLFTNTILRTEIERILAEMNEFNQIMFRSAPVGLTIFDEDLHFVDCNDVILNIFGTTKEDYFTHYYHLAPEYQSDGTKTYEKTIATMRRALDGETLVMEWMYRTITGEPIPCEITLTRAIYNGKYIGLCYLYDLRQIKKMEERIKLLELEVDKAYYDALTGIYNRRFFDENMMKILKSLSRSGSMLSVMMIDIDHFKKYNDTYGHSDGDKCLKAVADVLANVVTRDSDFVVRIGGEEFLIVLPYTSEEGACVVAKKLLDSIRNRNLPHKSSETAQYVTISIGVTVGKVDFCQKVDDYIKLADELLYESKHLGRNRFTCRCLEKSSE